MTVRLATEDDLDQIKFIAQQHSQWLGYVRWPMLREDIAKDHLIVAVKGGTVLGFCCFSAVRGKGRVSIELIAVRDEYRRTGVGSELLGYFTQHLKLKVLADNHVAVEFYARHGFSVVAQMEDRNRPLLVMER